MPLKVFGSTSGNTENKIDTSLPVQKPYLRTSYIEPIFEEDIDKKYQYRNENLEDPISNKKAPSKNADTLFNNPSIIKNTAHVELNEKSLDNVRFVKINRMHAIGEHMTAKYYVDHTMSNSTDQSLVLGLDPDEKVKPEEQDSIIPSSILTSPKTIK